MSADYVEIAAMLDAEQRAVIQEYARDARENEWEYWVDDCPVLKELRDLAMGIREAMPEVKFRYTTSMRETNHKTDEDGIITAHRVVHVAKELHVYLENCPFALGHISYKDNKLGCGTNMVYCVYSRKIANDKYREWREQYYTAASKDLTKAIRNARKYLTPYTIEELAGLTYRNLYQGVSDSASRIHRKVEESIEKIDQKVLLEEILHLKKIGVEFTTVKFKEVAETIEELNRESVEESTRKVTGIFVRLRKVGEDTYADVLNTYDVRGNYRMAKQSSTTCKVEELPSSIYERLSVLSILTNQHYVAKVGYRVDASTYWIESDGRA